MSLKKKGSRSLAMLLSAVLVLSAGSAAFAADETDVMTIPETQTEVPELPGGTGGMGGGTSSGVDSYTALVEYTEDATVSGETYASTGTDENAILVSGGNVTIDGATITRISDDSTGGDNSSFYGVGAAVLTTDGILTITDSTITSDAAGGAGVFAYGDGVVYVSDTVISTAQDTSGGVHVAGGGTLYATDVTATTQGESSAAVRSDRGSGLLVVSGGTFTSSGTGSPAVYSTATIAIEDATLTAENSEAICIEGLNSIYLFDCDLSGNMHDFEQNGLTWNVILYQSMSGDSEVGNSTFQMVGGTLTANNGGMFYTTNTESTFILQDVEITYSDDADFFLQVTGNTNGRGWGTSGANGADCTFTAISQEMEGSVIWDSISTLDFYMTEGSSLTGAFVQTTEYGTGDGEASLYISEDSVWTVTADSVLTNLRNAGTIIDADGNTVTVQGTDGTVYVEGDSAYTVTVTTYSETADLSGASEITDYEDAQVNTASSSSSDSGMGGDPGAMGEGMMGGDPGAMGEGTMGTDGGFVDVRPDAWYYTYVQYVQEKGLMDGTGNGAFSPDASITCGMVTTILARLDGQDTDTGSVWYEAGMTWAEENGISSGIDATQTLTRAQFVQMLWRYAGSPSSDFDLSAYTDAADLTGDAATAFSWAVEVGLVNGTTTSTLDVTGTLTRAQTAALLTRYCELQGL